MRLVAVDVAEGVHVPGGDEAVHPGAFDGQEAGVFLVGLGPGEVDGAVGRVEVAADHDGLGAAQLFGMGEERVVIAHFIGQPPVVLGPVGKVDIEKMEGGVFDVQKAAFPLITGIGEFAVHGERLEGGLLAREDRDARIAFLDLRGQPFGIPALGAAVFFGDLRRLGLGFLKRHHIGVGGGEPVPVGFAAQGAEPVDVP